MAADTRENAIPTESDIAFARVRRRRMTGPEEGDEPAVAPAQLGTGGGDTEMAQLRAELAELRKMIAGGKAPTSARRIGDVADAEDAAERAGQLVSELVDPAGLKDGQFVPKKGSTEKQLADAIEAQKAATQQVDIARCLAGEIPKTHPGLRNLAANHPVFRIR